MKAERRKRSAKKAEEGSLRIFLIGAHICVRACPHLFPSIYPLLSLFISGNSLSKYFLKPKWATKLGGKICSVLKSSSCKWTTVSEPRQNRKQDVVLVLGAWHYFHLKVILAIAEG